MIRDTIEVKLTKEYKERALEIVENTIEKVASKNNVVLSNQDKRKLKNLCFDQININVSSKSKTKTFWTFDSEASLPVIIEKEEEASKLGNYAPKKIERGVYKMKPNLVWTLVKDNSDKTGLNKQEFEKKVLSMLLEDFETAVFYGTLSYITESDSYER